MEEKKFKDGSFFLIFGWMTNKLGLTGLKREVYAIIYHYSQDGYHYLSSGVSFIAEATNSSLISVRRCIRELKSDGYIKEVINEDGISLLYADLEKL